MSRKRGLGNRIGSLLLCACMAAGLLCETLPVYGQSSGETIKGEEQTVQISSADLDSRTIDFNDGWKFLQTSSAGDDKSSAQSAVNFNDSSWKSVTLPYDFSISTEFTTGGEAESGFLLGGTGWYRKSFIIPTSFAGKEIVLNFGGAYMNSYVYVNGTKVGENHDGYTSFAFDITDYLSFDGTTENVIAVKVVNTVPSSRWYTGSGINRRVELILTDSVHIAYEGTQVTTPKLKSSGGSDGTVHIRAQVENDRDTAAEVTVRNKVYNSEGSAVSSAVEKSLSVDKNSDDFVEMDVAVSVPKLWKIGEGTMYTVRTEVLEDGKTVDSYDTEFGYRYTDFNGTDGFMLNGQKIKLNGVCLHEDQGALGCVESYDALYRQISKLKDMGVNCIRTSHNPFSSTFMDICNDLGMMVLEDCFDGWDAAKNGNNHDFSEYFSTKLSDDNMILGKESSYTWGEFALASMIRRDRNEPCLIMWSICNEVVEGTAGSSNLVSIADDFIDMIKNMDGTHPVTLGDNSIINFDLITIQSHIVDAGGVEGYNYASSYMLDTKGSSEKAILCTETSSAVNSRSRYQSEANASAVDGKYHLTSYDTSAVSWGMTAHQSLYNTMTRDFVLGEFVWTGWDYTGEPTPWNGTGTGSVSGSGAIPNTSYFGIVDTAGFEKDTYYFYRSQWNQDSNTLHLVTAWDSDNQYIKDEKTPVVIYSNAAKVELYRNGTLIGTADRKVNTTAAGHSYYTYQTESIDETVCEAVEGTDSTGLYATFNVAYEAGMISAKAYDESGKEITDSCAGNTKVSTPGTVSKLAASCEKTEIDADGRSIAYISVSVEDQDGVLDTMADSKITFSLSGDGEIVGVDNGDQADVNKYQQSGALKSTSEAFVSAYGGKALVIVRSTKTAGSFTVKVSSEGLSSDSVTVKTKSSGESKTQEGLVSYTMIRDYTVMEGTSPSLETSVTGHFGDGSDEAGTVSWENISSDTYGKFGDYTIKGTAVFEENTCKVSARLHVIGNAIAMENIAAVTAAGTSPVLPATVTGLKADAGECGSFEVTWKESDLTESRFTNVGDIVTVNGTAAVFGDHTLPVTASVRVAEKVNTESTNIAADILSITQDCQATSGNGSLESLYDGVTDNKTNSKARWTNTSNRKISDTAAVTMTWATAHELSGINLYFYTNASLGALPENVKIEYSLNGTDFKEITYAPVIPSAGFTQTVYTFDRIIDPVAIRITLTQKSGYYVGLTEVEVMTYAGKIDVNSGADLSGITADGIAVDGFDADTLACTAYVTDLSTAAVTAVGKENMGITVLPALSDVVRIITRSEDGSASKTYEVTLKECKHGKTQIINQKDATCTEEGYTGDTKCSDCGTVIAKGTVTEKTDHIWDEGTVTKEASCTETGVRTYQCSVCKTEKTEEIEATGHSWAEDYTVDQEPTCTKAGSKSIHCMKCTEVKDVTEIPATEEHTWDDGTVTKEPACTGKGEKTYTCTVCQEVKTEEIPATGHTVVIDAAVPATTTMTGLTEGSHCSVCGMVLSPQTVIPATVLTPDKAPLDNPVSQDRSGLIGRDISEVNKILTKAGEVKGTVYQLLKLRKKRVSNSSVTIRWEKQDGADAYAVYGAKCGNKFKKLATVKKNYYCHKKLKKGTYYKYFVVALKEKTVMATSKIIHVATSGGSVGNYRSVSLGHKSLSLMTGEKYDLKPVLTPSSKKLTVRYHRAVGYESSNPSVAAVSSGGKISARGAGICYVYAYAQDGVFAKVKVTVK